MADEKDGKVFRGKKYWDILKVRFFEVEFLGSPKTDWIHSKGDPDPF